MKNEIQEKYYNITMENKANITEIKNDISWIKITLGEIKQSVSGFEDKFVTKEEFSPIKKAYYAVMGAVGLALLGGMLSLVLRVR